jgi:Flp pilus assembly protein TadD
MAFGLVLLAAAIGAAASGEPAPARIVVDYPQEGSIFPPGIVPPTFLWHDSSSAVRWTVGWAGLRIVDAVVTAPPRGEVDSRCISPTNEVYTPTPYQASAKAWVPSADVWQAMQQASARTPVELEIAGLATDGAAVSRGRVTMSTSPDPVGALLFYRDVPLMPSSTQDGVIKPLDQSAQPLIQWRLKDVTREDSRVVLKDLPTCANCHSFSDHGKLLAMDVDGPDGDKGAYAIAPITSNVVIDDPQIMTWNAFAGKPKGHMTLGFLSRISPDGRFVVSTVNERLYVRNFPDYRIIQTFFPTRGILAWYDVASKQIRALPGADDRAFVHCNPVWTPDGRDLVFMRAPSRDPYDPGAPVALASGDPNETRIQFDLYRMPWNGGRGGRPMALRGASENGSSNSFPKISPDGKWLVWVRSRNGMLLRPDGKLWIMPSTGGTPRLMRCNTPFMNSWHSFSPNGRWMVFSSKANTPYTQLFLTHLDANGDDSPPILVERTQAANRAANIPEFVDVPYDAFLSISIPATEHRTHFYRANDLAQEGKTDEAIGELEKALQGEPKDWRNYDWKYHDKLSRLLMERGRNDDALVHIRKSLEINPANPAAHANLASILFERGSLDEARKELDAALRLAPNDAKAWLNRGMIRLSQGDSAGALDDLAHSIAIAPANAAAWSARGMAAWAVGDVAGAATYLDKALSLSPNDVTSLFFRAKVRIRGGDLAGAAADLERAAARAPAGSPQRADCEAMLVDVRRGLAPR